MVESGVEVNIGDSEAATSLYWDHADIINQLSSVRRPWRLGRLSEVPTLVLTHDDRLLLRNHVHWADSAADTKEL